MAIKTPVNINIIIKVPSNYPDAEADVKALVIIRGEDGDEVYRDKSVDRVVQKGDNTTFSFSFTPTEEGIYYGLAKAYVVGGGELCTDNSGWVKVFEVAGEGIHVTELIVQPDPALPWKEVTITAVLRNNCNIQRTANFQLYVDGGIIRTEDVTLNPLETKEFTSPWKFYELGIHKIVANPGEVSRDISVAVIKLYETENPRVTIANFGESFYDPLQRFKEKGVSTLLTSAITSFVSAPMSLVLSATTILDWINEVAFPPTFEIYVQEQYLGGEGEFVLTSGGFINTRKTSEPLVVMIIYEGGKKSPQDEIFNFRLHYETSLDLESPPYDLLDFDINSPSTYYNDGFFVICLDGTINEEGIWDWCITHNGETHGFSVEVGEFTSIIDYVKGIIDDLWGKGQKLFAFECPVNATITDQYGRIINDEGINEIPYARVEILDKTKMFFIPTDLTYKVNISAYDTGNFTFTQITPISEEIASETSFTNISVNPSTKASVEIEPGVTDYTMSIDYNGDGATDEERSPDVSETIEVPTPTTIVFEDDFRELNLNTWIPFGSPSPRVLASAEGRTGVFDNNGDGWCNSGVVSKDNFSFPNGCTMESDIYLDVTNIAGCWNSPVIGLTRQNKPTGEGVCPSESYPMGVIFGIEYDGDACWGTPEEKRRHAYFNIGLYTEDGTWESVSWLNADDYTDAWHNFKIAVGSDRIVKFYVDNELIYTSKKRINETVLQEKKIFLGIRSSGSAGKSYHDYIKVYATTTPSTVDFAQHSAADSGDFVILTNDGRVYEIDPRHLSDIQLRTAAGPVNVVAVIPDLYDDSILAFTGDGKLYQCKDSENWANWNKVGDINLPSGSKIVDFAQHSAADSGDFVILTNDGRVYEIDPRHLSDIQLRTAAGPVNVAAVIPDRYDNSILAVTSDGVLYRATTDDDWNTWEQVGRVQLSGGSKIVGFAQHSAVTTGDFVFLTGDGKVYEVDPRRLSIFEFRTANGPSNVVAMKPNTYDNSILVLTSSGVLCRATTDDNWNTWTQVGNIVEYPPRSLSFKSKGVYVWGFSEVILKDKDEQKRFFELCKEEGIKTVFLSINKDWLTDSLPWYNSSNYTEFIKGARERKMQVHAMMGNWDWAKDVSNAEPFVEAVLVYNSKNPTCKFDGIHLDVEPENHFNSTDEFLKGYKDLIAGIKTKFSYSGETFQGMSLSIDVACWWLTNQSRNEFKGLIGINDLDYITIMAYEDKAEDVEKLASEVVKVTQEKSKPFVISLETQEFPGIFKDGEFIPDQSEGVTFFEEGQSEFHKTLEQLQDRYKDNGLFKDFAIHFYQTSFTPWHIIESTKLPSGTFKPGDTVSVSVTLKTSDYFEDRPIAIGFSVRDDEGNVYPDDYIDNGLDVDTSKIILIKGIDKETVELEWTVPNFARGANYDLTISVWDIDYNYNRSISLFHKSILLENYPGDITQIGMHPTFRTLNL